MGAALKMKLKDKGLDSVPVFSVNDPRSQEAAVEHAQAARKAGIDGVDFFADSSTLTPEVVRSIKACGLQVGVWVWTEFPKSDTPATAMAMERSGVEFFTSDLPPSIRMWMDGRRVCRPGL